MTMRTTPMRYAGAAGLVALCLTLGACNGTGAPGAASLEQSVAAPPSQMMALSSGPMKTAAPAGPVATLPAEAGAVQGARSHGYVDGFRQDINLAGSPVAGIQNGLTVLARTSRKSTLDEATPLYKPAEAGIRTELARQFPHIAMQVVERPSSNAYGPYGLALGRGPGTAHCLYMWQWIDENRLPREAGLSGPLTIRVRLCQKDTTFDAMAAMLDHLSIDANAPTALAANEGIVEAPAAAPAKPTSHKHVRHASPHHAPRVAEVQHEDVAADVPPTANTMSAPATPTSYATDLPPQALLGPKSASPVKPN